MQLYKLASIPPPLDKMTTVDEKQKVLHKFTKANMKLNIQLDLH